MLKELFLYHTSTVGLKFVATTSVFVPHCYDTSTDSQTTKLKRPLNSMCQWGANMTPVRAIEWVYPHGHLLLSCGIGSLQLCTGFQFARSWRSDSKRQDWCGIASTIQPLLLCGYSICFCMQGHHHNGDWATRRPHTLCSICFHLFGALAKAVRLSIASLHNQQMYPNMCSIDIFVNLQPVR